MKPKYFQSDEDRAVAYAAYKALEKMLKADGDLAPGFYADMSGKSLTVTLPKGSYVERDKGTNGDGTYYKKATQNLYGYAFWALLILKLKKFNQWKAIKPIIMEALRESVRLKTTNVREQLSKENPGLVEEIEAFAENLDIPARKESTSRNYKSDLPASLVIVNRKAA